MRNTDSGESDKIRAPGPQIGEPLGARARGILEAAQRVLDRDGADKLTLRRLAREAGTTPSLVLYYFSSMDRLEAMLLDSLWHDLDVDFLSSIGSMPDDITQRVDALVDFHSSIAADPTRYHRYFELVSGVVTKPTARAEVAGIYREYRSELNVPLLAGQELTSDEAEALAALVLAIAEGLPFWQLVGRETVDPLHGFALLRRLLKRRLGVAIPQLIDTVDAAPKETLGQDNAQARPAVHDTAARLLEAGHEILRVTGLRGLSFENIAQVSGEARPAVGYHFGNKAGFVEALSIDVVRRWGTAIQRPGLWDDFLLGVGTPALAHDLEPVTMAMIQVFPVIQRSSAVHDVATTSLTAARAKLTAQLQTTAESGDRPAYLGSPGAAADLCVAAITGVTLQRMYDPDGFEHIAALDQLVKLFR